MSKQESRAFLEAAMSAAQANEFRGVIRTILPAKRTRRQIQSEAFLKRAAAYIETRFNAEAWAMYYAIKRSSDGTFFLQSDNEECVGDREFSSRTAAEAYRRERLKKDEARR